MIEKTKRTKVIRALMPAIVALGLAAPGGVLAASPAKGGLPPMLSFTFKDLGGVKSWKAGGDTVVFIKNKDDQWYRADMIESCMALDTKKGINFIVETDPETNARRNAVVVDRHICTVTSIKRVEASEVAGTK